MFVGIWYLKTPANVYVGRNGAKTEAESCYIYETDLPLQIGDKVITPTAKEPRQRGIVTMLNVAQPGFDCRKITEYDLDEALV